MENERIKSIIASLIFASPVPISLARIAGIIEEADRETVRRCAGELVDEWREAGRGIHVEEVAGGYQFRTTAGNAPWIKKLQKAKKWRLSRAALETVAIVAYRQPVTRAEVEELRRVDSGGVLRALLERKFVRVAGKKEVTGRPLLFGTTGYFLEFFGMKSLRELPTLEEVRSLGELEGPLPGLDGEEATLVRDELFRRAGEPVEGEGEADAEETEAAALDAVETLEEEAPIDAEEKDAEATGEAVEVRGPADENVGSEEEEEEKNG